MDKLFYKVWHCMTIRNHIIELAKKLTYNYESRSFDINTFRNYKDKSYLHWLVIQEVIENKRKKDNNSDPGYTDSSTNSYSNSSSSSESDSEEDGSSNGENELIKFMKLINNCYDNIKVLEISSRLSMKPKKMSIVFEACLPLSIIHFKNYDFGNLTDTWKQSNIEILEFDNYFNSYFDLNQLPRKLTKLIFGSSYNQSFIKWIEKKQHLDSWPVNLVYIKFGNSFNHEIPSFSLPSSLTYLEFGDSFNQKLEPNSIPSNVTNLIFSTKSRFNQKIENKNILPKELNQLVLGNGFNQKLNELINNTKQLQILNMKNCINYDHTISKLPSPMIMTELLLPNGQIFNNKHSLSLLKPFQLLVKLVISNFKKPGLLINNLPKTLKKLTIDLSKFSSLSNPKSNSYITYTGGCNKPLVNTDGQIFSIKYNESEIEDSLLKKLILIGDDFIIESIPLSVKIIKCNFKYLKQLSTTTTITNLKSIVCNDPYNWISNDKCIPKTLLQLTLGKGMKEKLSIQDTSNLELQHLEIRNLNGIPVNSNCYPPNLKSLILCVDQEPGNLIKMYQYQFPKSLRYLSIGNAIRDNFTSESLPLDIKVLELDSEIYQTLSISWLPLSLEILIVWGSITSIESLPKTVKQIYTHQYNKRFISLFYNGNNNMGYRFNNDPLDSSILRIVNFNDKKKLFKKLIQNTNFN